MTANDIDIDNSSDPMNIDKAITAMEDVLGSNHDIIKTITKILLHNGTINLEEYLKLQIELDTRKKEKQQSV